MSCDFSCFLGAINALFLQGSCWPGTAGCSFNRKGINMHSAPATKKTLFSAAVCALLAAAPAKATIYDEAVSGDLSNDKAAPTALTLTPGSNSVIGTVNGFRKRRPPGLGFIHDSRRLRDDLLCQFQVWFGDDQGFTGFQFGSSFSGDEFVAGNYAGYAHFGTDATIRMGARRINSRRRFAAADGRPKLRPGHHWLYSAARCGDIYLFDSAGRPRHHRLSI